MPSVLYVDDEETIGRAVARWFERRGHVVHIARSVDEAKRVLLHHTPDAIFVDVWLGTESGFELMSWIEDVRAQLADRVTFVTGELADSMQRGDRVWQTLAPASASALAIANPNPPSSATPATSARRPSRSMLSMGGR